MVVCSTTATPAHVSHAAPNAHISSSAEHIRQFRQCLSVQQAFKGHFFRRMIVRKSGTPGSGTGAASVGSRLIDGVQVGVDSLVGQNILKGVYSADVGVESKSLIGQSKAAAAARIRSVRRRR